MYRFKNLVILLMGIFLVLPSSLADVCQVTRSKQIRVTTQESRTITVVTYRRCYLFFRCATSKEMVAYSTAQRQVTTYFTSSECCDGFVQDDSGTECIRVTDKSVSTITDNPNQSLSPDSSQPNNSSSRNETSNVINVTPSSSTSSRNNSNSSSPLTTPTNQRGTPMTDGLNMVSRQIPRGAVIMISIILFFVVVIVLSIILICVVYRRRKVRRIQKENDNLHMEPLRDLQLISEPSSNIQHFAPPSAPGDEYAIVDKKTKDPTPTKEYHQSYENTCLGSDPFSSGSGANDKTKTIIDNVAKDTKQEESNRLTHTYMDGTVCLETNEMVVIPVSKSSAQENSYNEVDDTPTDKITTDVCYTEVDDVPSSLAGQKGGAQEYDYCYTDIDKPSPGPNECYAEVDDMVSSSVPKEGAKQQEYESIAETYDHLDRGSTPGESDQDKSTKEECATSSRKYGVLVRQSSSVDTPDSYDTFQRTVSETDQSGVDGYEPLLAVPSSGSNPTELVEDNVYDDLDRTMPKPRRKGKDLLVKLRQSSNTTAYGHLGSSFESDISEEGSEKISDVNPDMEPIYSNQDVAMVSDRDSTYTDMSGSRPGSVLSRSMSRNEKTLDNTQYTIMSPTHQSNTYCNVDLENNDKPH